MPVAVATFRLSSPGRWRMLAVWIEAMIVAGSPSPSVPTSSAVRGDGGMSCRSVLPRGDNPQVVNPSACKRPTSAVTDPSRTKGTLRTEPTETRIALRYIGSQLVSSIRMASTPKAAALRNIEPILS
jgi:hypothetical protein